MSRIIYQAGPLFTQSEKAFHQKLSAALRAAGHSVIWPGDLIDSEQIAAADSGAVSLIFGVCRLAIDKCTCMVALLDGAQVDDGTAWEIGYAYARGLPVYGLRTDSRMAGETGHNHVNSIIEGSLSGLAGDIKALVKLVQEVTADNVADGMGGRGRQFEP